MQKSNIPQNLKRLVSVLAPGEGNFQSVQIPPDFDELVDALVQSGEQNRALVLHDKALQAALISHGYIKVLGEGVTGSPRLIAISRMSNNHHELVRAGLERKSKETAPKEEQSQAQADAGAALIEDVVRHAQVIAVMLESLQGQIDALLQAAAPFILEGTPKQEYAELAKKLPPSKLRSRLEKEAQESSQKNQAR